MTNHSLRVAGLLLFASLASAGSQAQATASWGGPADTRVEVVAPSHPRGPSSGTFQSAFGCPHDPLIHETSCIAMERQNTTGWGSFSDPTQSQKRLSLRGKTTFAKATELAQQHATPPTPPPPQKTLRRSTAPPADKPVTMQVAPNPAFVAPSMFTVEVDQLLQASKAAVSAGKLFVRPIVDAGSGPSNGQQLFWHGGSVGAVLDLRVQVPAAAKYAVELYMTRGPEYGDLKIEVSGQPSPVAFSGFAPSIMAPQPTQAGTFSLQAGEHNVSFMISGKYPQSTDYVVGIDRIVFYPAGAP